MNALNIPCIAGIPIEIDIPAPVRTMTSGFARVGVADILDNNDYKVDKPITLFAEA
jgi:hypothetical protein